MRHAVTDLGAFGVVEPIHRTDEVARDAPDALELHAVADLPVHNGKMVELSHRPEISVAQLAREHGINDNLLFKWRQYWREGKLRPPSTTENNVPELLPITLDAEDVVPTTSPRSQPVAAAAPESLNISCEVTFRHGSLRLNGAISENILNLLIRELKR